MKFWDSSAIVPLLVAETSTKQLQALAGDDAMLVWWATPVECASALARLERDGGLDEAAAAEAFDRLKLLAASWHEVEAIEPVREAAVRFLRVHPLRAADAMQLAAAYIAARRQPSTLELVTLDDRVTTAARKEGFILVTPI